MCGITGIVNLTKKQFLPAVIKAMTDAIAHRGPDAEGFFIHNPTIALGHRRLSIIDLSTNANQPFIDNSQQYVIVFNGEIYNFLEVKKKLSNDYNFKTTSDTEVILAAYIKWKEDCLKYLNGMFAFAIWDKKEETLFIARDRIGVKPLYYHHNNDYFLFASEIRALLASNLIPRKLDNYALKNYLMFQSVYAPYTIVKDIFQLMPGEYAIISKQGFQKSTYWSIQGIALNNNFQEEKTILKQIRNLLTSSVASRMISDVPLGAFLSGGIDSSAVVGLMSEVSTQPINTFTISFQEKEFDESQYANIIAKKFNTKHTDIQLSPKTFLDSLPEALTKMDSPSGDGLNTYTVSKVTKQAGITVALSGIGGDELFAGYHYFQQYSSLNKNLAYYYKLPQSIKNLAAAIVPTFVKGYKANRTQEILKIAKPTIANIYPILRLVSTAEKINKMLTQSNEENSIIKNLLENKDFERFPLLSQVSIAELYGYTLNVLLKDSDQFSMASALEVREPFFDFRLIEYLLTIKDAYKYTPSVPKSLLVKAVAPMLPNDIVHRPKKGFSFPWKDWMLSELRPFCEYHLTFLGKTGYFNPTEIDKQWKLFISSNGKKVNWVEIWQLVTLSNWLKNNKIQA